MSRNILLSGIAILVLVLQGCAGSGADSIPPVDDGTTGQVSQYVIGPGDTITIHRSTRTGTGDR